MADISGLNSGAYECSHPHHLRPTWQILFSEINLNNENETDLSETCRLLRKTDLNANARYTGMLAVCSEITDTLSF